MNSKIPKGSLRKGQGPPARKRGHMSDGLNRRTAGPGKGGWAEKEVGERGKRTEIKHCEGVARGTQ